MTGSPKLSSNIPQSQQPQFQTSYQSQTQHILKAEYQQQPRHHQQYQPQYQQQPPVNNHQRGDEWKLPEKPTNFHPGGLGFADESHKYKKRQLLKYLIICRLYEINRNKNGVDGYFAGKSSDYMEKKNK